MLIAQLICRQLHKRKDPAWFEMNTNHRGLLIGVDHKILRVRTADYSTAKAVTNGRIAPVINPDPVLAQIDNQLGGAGGHEALFGVWLRISVVVPEYLDEIRERRPRNVVSELHRIQEAGEIAVT